MTRATAFAPASIGNVGPGFDVLGLAVDGIGDRVTVELTEGESRIEAITGRDAELVPLDPSRNCAAIAANAYLRRAHARAQGAGRRAQEPAGSTFNISPDLSPAPRALRPAPCNAIVSIDKGLPLAGGMGGSAASSVAGAYAAALAMNHQPSTMDLITAALEGESAVAGRHLDNIAPAVVGGLALSRSVDPIDVIKLPVAADWWVALVTPRVRIQTKDARALLPNETDRATWIQQMANTTALAHAFATGDGELLRRALDDRYAEPRRAPLIPRFHDVKKAALEAGAFACTISGSGPTLFAITADERTAHACAEAMTQAFGEIAGSHVGPIAKTGARREL